MKINKTAIVNIAIKNGLKDDVSKMTHHQAMNFLNRKVKEKIIKDGYQAIWDHFKPIASDYEGYGRWTVNHPLWKQFSTPYIGLWKKFVEEGRVDPTKSVEELVALATNNYAKVV